MGDEQLTGEVWKAIPFADGYSVSSLGRFRADRQTSNNWKAGLRKPMKLANGYSYIRFLSGGKMKRMYLSRVVATVFHGEPPTPEHHCAHNDGDPSNNKACNLRWATPRENNHDKRLHGTYLLGEATTSSKLTDDAVRFIRLSKLSGSALAKMYGVTRRAVDRARCGDGWRHIDVPPVPHRRAATVSYMGEIVTIGRLAERLGIHVRTLRYRIFDMEWPEEKWGLPPDRYANRLLNKSLHADPP